MVASSAITYRPEIDGLRAIAVVAVILYHAGYSLISGGFIGVDIFFVISGYLICSLILKELESGTFSLLEFYERRARRILPALFLIVIVSATLALFVFSPHDLRQLGLSIASTSVFASNVYFWLTSGYYGNTAELHPLLHTWSLALEEQFYLLFPIIMLVMWKWAKRYMLVLLGLAFLGSLAFAEYASSAMPSAAFFLLPARAWELLIGAVAAMYMNNGPISANLRMRSIAASLGIAMITVSILGFDEATPVPGSVMLLPALGTVLIILFADKQNIPGRFLSNRILVGIGLLSYSAYLWHQPLFAFARRTLVSQPGPIVIWGLITLTFVLSYLSWRFVEQPFRNRSWLSRKSVFGWSIAASALALGTGFALHKSDGFPMRFEPDILRLATEDSNRVESDDPCNIRTKTLDSLRSKIASCYVPNRTMYLIGDSHARALEPSLRARAQENGITLIALTNNGCFPVEGFVRAGRTKKRPFCELVTKNLRAIVDEMPGPVTMAARWRLVLSGERFDNGENGVEAKTYQEFEADGYRDNLYDRLVPKLEGLAEDTPLILIQQIPEAGWDVPQMMIRRKRFESSDLPPLSTSFARYRAANAKNIVMFNRLGKHENINLVDPSLIVCNSGTGRCLNETDGAPLYRDDDHPSIIFSKQIAEVVFDQVDPAPLMDNN